MTAGIVFAIVGAGCGYALDLAVGRPAEPALAPTAALVWLLVVAVNRGYDARLVGHGGEEFTRVLRSFVLLAATVAIGLPLLPSGHRPRQVMIVLSALLGTELLWRGAGRLVRAHHRAGGSGGGRGHAVLAVGAAADVVAFARALLRDHSAGMVVRGACTLSPPGDTSVGDLGAAGVIHRVGIEDAPATAVAIGARTVAVVSPDAVGTDAIRRIRLALEDTDLELVVAPCLDDLGASRLRVRTVAGVPLVQVGRPDLAGARRAFVAALERLVALVALVVLAPVLLGVWVAVRVTSPGPALFRQTRVGRHGRTFTMLKFRSMSRDAEDVRAALTERNVHGDGVLFKVLDDPRVTGVGRVLRRYSLDELPQLINVLAGHMALVGPRPPLPAEVLRYPVDAHRRLLVRPGLTGLWQVSGRSDLSWEDSLRLDLRYVENWSPTLDLKILCRTPKAVVRGSGAY